MSERWRRYGISEDASHHVFHGRPAYASRFREVLKFHEPGLAPVLDDSGAYHVGPDGLPAYAARHVRTFGFYEGLAAVHSEDGWLHVLPDGEPLYSERYAWCGNFQEGRCAVRLPGGRYFHITADGSPAYGERYRYAGDFKDGHAVVQGDDGKHTHVDAYGNFPHGRWFDDLDVFHKGYARARDAGGWHHVDIAGEALYGERFENVEPFYNGQARVQAFDESLSVIDELGRTLLELRGPSRSNLELLSGDMVGLWRTKTIHAAVELGVFEALPASAEQVGRNTRVHRSVAARLMRALMELGLVRRDERDVYRATERGELLTGGHPFSLAEAARHWGEEAYAAWAAAAQAFETGVPPFDEMYGEGFFEWIRGYPVQLLAYQSAMATYARHDYRGLAGAADFTAHAHILDAGGGTGELAFALLRACPGLKATVMDMPEVVETARVPGDLEGRCDLVAGDLFERWPDAPDAVVLARVLHDWPDGEALYILRRAREAMRRDATLYVIEMVLDESGGAGGLLDLHMLVMTQGAERTERQFKDILRETGFELLDVSATGAVSSVIRARAS